MQQPPGVNGVVSPRFTLAILGRLELSGPNGAVEMPGRKATCLLAYLACTAPQPQQREKLAALLWGSHFEAQARQNLRQALFHLRRTLGADAFILGEAEVSLAPGSLSCDAVQLQALVQQGSREAIAEAIDLYKGRLLADVAVAEEGWSVWLSAEQQRLEELALSTVIRFGESELASGRGEGALEAARRALAINNLREDAHRLGIKALASEGRTAEAQKLYRDLAKLLREELNTEPDRKTKALIEGLRDGTHRTGAIDDPVPAAFDGMAECAGKPCIAVLPFRNMSDAKQAGDYFADGIADEIIVALSRFHEVVVIARGSSFAFKGKELTHRKVAERLGASFVLDGTIRRSGSRIRISAELTHAASDALVWSERYDRPLADIFDLHDDISVSVAAAVAPAIRDAEIRHARGRRPANLSAYDCYLRALPFLWAGTRDDVARAIGLLRQSLTLDQMSGSTMAALAWGLIMAAPLGADSPPEARAEAQDLARRAVELDATDAFAHAVYGFTLLRRADENEQGRLHCEEATRLNPGSAFAWGTLGVIASMAGDYENAVECLDRALTLSPFDPMLHLWMTGLAASNFALGRHETGIVWARKSIQQNPANGMGHRLLAANLAVAGRVDEARTVTSRRDAVQRTTLREMRMSRYFRQAEVLCRYLSAQRMAGVAE